MFLLSKKRLTKPSWPDVITATLLISALAVLLSGDAFYARIASRIAILGIAAMGLNLLVGYSGLVSFGHAVFLGAGAYTAGLLSSHGFTSMYLALPVAALASAGLAVAIGVVSLKTRGVYFIMITLAFAQMVYFAAVSYEPLGGLDGIRMRQRSSMAPLDTENPSAFLLICLVLCAATAFFCARLVQSQFGRLLQAARDNEQKASAIGFWTFPYQLVTFAIAGALAGIAGVLHANLNGYVSPDVMSWVMSGDLLVMIAIGGAASIFGPLVGAAVFVVLEVVLTDWVRPWTIVFGPLLVILVLYAKSGIFTWAQGQGSAR